MKTHPPPIASALLLLATLPAWAQSPAGGAYDGLWQVHLSCDDAHDKAGALVKGCEFDFAAEVREGKLRGQFDAQRGHTERIELRRRVADYARRS